MTLLKETVNGKEPSDQATYTAYYEIPFPVIYQGSYEVKPT